MNILNEKKNLSDEQLVVLSLESHLAFLVLVDRYRARILNFVSRMSGLSGEDAQDVLFIL